MTDDEYKYLWGRRHNIVIRALSNRIYHQERQKVFEFREGFIKAISICAGSLAFAKISEPDISKWFVALITVLSTFSLVFGYGNKARDSAKRSIEWTQLERDIERIGQRDFTEVNINEWVSRANEIEADEPAVNRILFELCFERANETLGGQADIKLNKFQRLIPHVFMFIS